VGKGKGLNMTEHIEMIDEGNQVIEMLIGLVYDLYPDEHSELYDVDRKLEKAKQYLERAKS